MEGCNRTSALHRAHTKTESNKGKKKREECCIIVTGTCLALPLCSRKKPSTSSSHASCKKRMASVREHHRVDSVCSQIFETTPPELVSGVNMIHVCVAYIVPARLPGSLSKKCLPRARKS